MNRFIKNFFIAVWVTPIILYSQVTDTLIVVKPLDPVVKTSQKILDQPNVKDTIEVKQEIKYTFVDVPFQAARIIDTIAPVKVKSEAVNKLYHQYVRLGVGSNFNKIFSASINGGRSSKYRYSMWYDHFSSNGLARLNYDNFSHNQAGGDFTVFWDETMFTAKLNYTRNAFHYYGIFDRDNRNIEITDRTFLLNHFVYINPEFRFKDNLEENSLKLRHDNILGYTYTTNANQVNEHFFNYRGNWGKRINRDLYTVSVYGDYNSFRNKLSERNGIVKITPHIRSTGKRLDADLGFSVNMQFDTIAHFYFFPDLHVKYELVKDAFIPFVNVKGGVVRNNLRNFSMVNNFIDTSAHIQNTIDKFEIQGGWRVSFSRRIYFVLDATFKNVQNMPFWIKNYNDPWQNKFILVYDNMDWLKFRFNFAYDENERMKAGLYVYYNDYRTQNEKRAWHMPVFEYGGWIMYNLADKFIGQINLHGFDKQYVKLPDYMNQSEGMKLKGFTDLNLRFEYRYTDRISAFVSFNNILSQSYQRWQDYNTQRFNLMGGFTFGF